VPKLIVQLCGGLGNQMFQYATARALSELNGALLVLDTYSGFARDFEYQREYELEGMAITSREASLAERMPFWTARIAQKITGKRQPLIIKKWYGCRLNETKFKFHKQIKDLKFHGSCWMTGYWQSPRYFDDIEVILQKELMPLEPEQPFREMGEQMRGTNSVALGIRLYEESSNPGAHAAGGRIKSVESINQAILGIERKQADCHFYIFCTHRSPILDELQFNNEVTYVTHDDGFMGSHQRLWLLTQCRHHLFTNSTYYWWGAWLSRVCYPRREQMIYAPDNFINTDSIVPIWQIF
jgi:hypothetical protein